jgi:hypothetical protein
MKEWQYVLIIPDTNKVKLSLFLGVFQRSMKASLVKPISKNTAFE